MYSDRPNQVAQCPVLYKMCRLNQMLNVWCFTAMHVWAEPNDKICGAVWWRLHQVVKLGSIHWQTEPKCWKTFSLIHVCRLSQANKYCKYMLLCFSLVKIVQPIRINHDLHFQLQMALLSLSSSTLTVTPSQNLQSLQFYVGIYQFKYCSYHIQVKRNYI